MPGRRALMVVNRHSREGGADLTAVIEQLEGRNIAVVPAVTDSLAEAANLVRARARAFDMVIVGGGDGTVSSLVPAVLEVERPLGILPMGTANDLARTLGLPTEWRQAAEVIGLGQEHRIDLGRVNGRYFLNAASIGLGVAVNRGLSAELKGRWGAFSYARNLATVVGRARPFVADIVCDGERERLGSIQITVGNGRHYGGGMTVASDAAIDDQLLDVYSIPPQSPWQLLKLLPALRQGTHGRFEEVCLRRGRNIEIHTSRPKLITADGEPVSRTPATFDLVPEALSVFVSAQRTEGLKHVAQ